MIHLHSDCLVFELPDGDAIPCSAEAVAFEIVGDTSALADPEIIRHAAAAVLHFFRHEKQREAVSVREFTEALGKVLQGMGVHVLPATTPGEPGAGIGTDGAVNVPLVAGGATQAPAPAPDADLGVLASEAGTGFELTFFPRLRAEVRTLLDRSPGQVRFRGLRLCVLQLTGARRWNRRCEDLQEQIVEFLRQTLTVERRGDTCNLVVL